MDEGKNRGFIIVAIIVVIALGVIGYLLGGAKGVAGMLQFLKWGIVAVLIIGLAVWGAWFLFIRKTKDDRVALNVKTISDQARLTKPATINNLYLSGDLEHPQVLLGQIVGYSRIKNILNEEEDVFIFKKTGFPMNLFEEPKAVRVNPDQHSQMIGDIIMKGISLVSHGGFLYVNNEHLDIERIDRTIKTEVIRKYTMDVLRDVKIISDMAVGINPEHSKFLEGKSLLKIPSRTDPMQQQQGSYEAPRGSQP